MSEPVGNVGGIDIYKLADRTSVPRDSLSVMAFHGQAVGAIPRGRRVVKCNTEPGDTFPDGTMGTVLSSAALPDNPKNVKYGYYVAFDPDPMPCFIAGYRIKEPTE